MFSIKIFTLEEKSKESLSVYYFLETKWVILACLCFEKSNGSDVLIGYKNDLFNIREFGNLIKKRFRN